MDFVYCPTCDQPAEIEWRASLGSTDGPTELVKLRCLSRHHYLMPSEGLVPMTEPVRHADAHH